MLKSLSPVLCSMFLGAVLVVCFALSARAETAAFLETFVSYENIEDQGVKFPDISVFDMQDRPVQWSDIRKEGQYVVVNVWALFCPPCIKEIPSLLALKEAKGGEKFDVVFLAMDYPESGAELQKRMADSDVPALDGYYIKDLRVWMDLGLKGLPSSFLLGPEGQILYRFLGDSNWSGEAALAFFDEILEKNQKR